MFGIKRHESGPVVYGALIDISSGSVGVAIVASHIENQVPILFYTHRTMLRVTEHELTKAEGIRKVQEALLSASLILSQDGVQALRNHDAEATISKLYVTCSSPWAFTIARSASLSEEKEFKITSAVINDLVRSAQDEIVSGLTEKKLITAEGFQIVEQATVDITINDYPITDPVNLRGTSLSLSHIAGLIPKEILNSIHEVQEKIFPATTLRAHTSMLVMYCVMRELFPRSRSICIIDITGEATEFGLVENNLLIENSYIPYGSNTFIRDIMKNSSKPQSDIVSDLQSFDTSTHLIPAQFSQEAEIFESALLEALTHILERRALPNDIIITVHRPYEQFFRHLFEKVFAKATGRSAHIVNLDATVIDEISQGAEDDVYLALGARFFHKIHGCGEFNGS